MDIVKFRLFKNPNGHPHANIYINGKNLANMIAKNERLLYKQQTIDFLWHYGYVGLPPFRLLKNLLFRERADIMGDGDWDEYDGCSTCSATIIETENTIIWTDLTHSSRRKKRESRKNLLDGLPLKYGEENTGLDYSDLHFEFDKKQYFNEIRELFKMVIENYGEETQSLLLQYGFVDVQKGDDREEIEEFINLLSCFINRAKEMNIKEVEEFTDLRSFLITSCAMNVVEIEEFMNPNTKKHKWKTGDKYLHRIE